MNKKDYCFRITDDVLPEGLQDSLVKTGLKFMVRDIGSDTEEPHFQGIGLVQRAIFVRLLRSMDIKAMEFILLSLVLILKVLLIICAKELVRKNLIFFIM